MTQEERDGWRNLLLLCREHHRKVDAKANEGEYPAALLKEWKVKRENGLIGDLPKLQGLTDLDFEQLLVQQAEGILDSIEKLQGVSKGIATELKNLVEERFTAPQLDLDAVNALDQATMRLHHMSFSDYVSLLYGAVDDLRHMSLPDQTILLRGIVDELKTLQYIDPDDLERAHRALDRVGDRLEDQIRALSESTDAHEVASEKAIAHFGDFQQHYWIDDIRRFWPFITKAFITGLVVGGAAIGFFAAWVTGAI